MTNTTTTTSANLYPFITKSQIKAKLAESFEYRCDVIRLLYALQTAYEQSTSSTLNKNKQGFMSSHAVWGSKIARKLNAGQDLSAEEQEKVDTIAPRYSRQMARFERARAIANQPALRAIAGVFSAAVDEDDAMIAQAVAAVDAKAEEPAPEAEAVAPEAEAVETDEVPFS